MSCSNMFGEKTVNGFAVITENHFRNQFCLWEIPLRLTLPRGHQLIVFLQISFVWSRPNLKETW